MGAAEKIEYDTMLQNEFDEIFLLIFKDICKEILLITENAVKNIIGSSSEFLSDSAKKAVNEFHKLYFSQNGIQNQKDLINQEVDSIFDAIKKELENGVEEKNLGKTVHENSESKEARLTLAATQKQLETLISLDQNIKRKLLPVLASMQFEDMVKQILQRQNLAWVEIKTYLEKTKSSKMVEKEQEKLIETIQMQCIGTQFERRSFYKHVLQAPAPADVEKSENWFDIISK
jgi:hypothetical protein